MRAARFPPTYVSTAPHLAWAGVGAVITLSVALRRRHPLGVWVVTIAGAALLLTGLGGAGFATTQATLVYLAAPPEMRSRILGVLTVCIGTGPIGFLWLGWLADRIGSHDATAVTGVLGLLALAATWRWWKEI